ncbi:MAG: DNA methylase [Promethearchaeota archaeon CR_4]|nr:MAG: DNA methylase [Candidatus Lokiarchaeota archaeon CR_4]
MRKRELINILQNLKGFRKYDLQKEQYLIDAVTAADILYIVGFENGELFERLVFDLGCGPGRLLLGATILGITTGVGVDVDLDVLTTCRENAREIGVQGQIHLLLADINHLPLRIGKDISLQDRTVLMNPPFGKQARYADRQFLEAAFETAKNIYSVHLSHPKTRIFLGNFADKRGFFVDAIYEFSMILEHTQSFHTRARKKIFVNLCHFVKKRES